MYNHFLLQFSHGVQTLMDNTDKNEKKPEWYFKYSMISFLKLTMTVTQVLSILNLNLSYEGKIYLEFKYSL